MHDLHALTSVAFAVATIAAQSPTFVTANHTVVSPFTQPVQIGSLTNANHDNRLRLSIRPDAVNGAEADTLEFQFRNGTGPYAQKTFVFEGGCTAPVDREALWIVTVRDDQEVPTDLYPSQATSFSLYSATDEYVLAWSGVPWPTGTGQIDVEIRVSLGASQHTARTTADVRWEVITRNAATPSGPQYHLDKIEAPRLPIYGPSAPVASETHAQAQVRTRVFIPVSISATLPYSNFSMSRVYDLSRALHHPGAAPSAYSGASPVPVDDQTLQMSAVHCIESYSALAGGAVLTLGTRDFIGYRKDFNHSFYECETTGGNSDGYYAWSHSYFPPLDHSTVTLAADNDFESSYPVVISALQPRSAAWWYDVTDYYREILRSESTPSDNVVTTARDQSSILNQDIYANGKTPVYLLATMAKTNLAEPFDNAIESARGIKAAVSPSGGFADVPAIVQFQEWLETDSSFSNPMPFPPIGGTLPDEGLVNKEPFNVDRRLRASQLATLVDPEKTAFLVYTYPRLFNETRGWLDVWTYPGGSPADPLQYDRQQQKINVSSAMPTQGQYYALDLAHPNVASWWGSGFCETVFQSQAWIRGLYIDGVAGFGGYLRFEGPTTPPASELPGQYNGGYLPQEGRIHLIEATRAALANQTWSNNEFPGPLGLVVGETFEEYLMGRLDTALFGLSGIPGRYAMREKPNTPIQQAVHSRPPVPTMVYHEWAPVEAVGVMPTTSALLYNGITEDQFFDYSRFVHGLAYISGRNPLVFPHFWKYADYRLFGADSSGNYQNGPGFSLLTDQLLGTEYKDYLGMFYDARDPSFAGDYLLAGRAERPLLEYHGTPAISKTPSPLAFAEERYLSAPLGSTEREAYETLLRPYSETLPGQISGLDMVADEQVPLVYHSVWTHGDHKDTIAIVLLNWSNADANWRGQFHPSLYGLSPGQPYTIEVSALGSTVGSSPTNPYYSASGNLSSTFDVLSWHQNAGGTINLPLPSNPTGMGGPVPPRTTILMEISW